MNYLHTFMPTCPKQISLLTLLLTTLVSTNHAQDKQQKSPHEEANTHNTVSRAEKNIANQSHVAKPANTDNYLDSLAAEAGVTEVDESSQVSTEARQDKNQQPDKINWDINNQRSGMLSSNLKPEQFEKTLQDNFFASYVVYQTLNAASKHQIYKEYLKKPDINYLRKRMITLSK